MSKLNSINGGYNGESPRIKSDNIFKPDNGVMPKQLDPNQVVNSLKKLHSGGNLTQESLITIISELNKLIS
jgi:hypothetical protein|tara:strand:+ start:259 stop:471 length:213 start_codon:yes stop_codon:yes gene_type:complete